MGATIREGDLKANGELAAIVYEWLRRGFG